MSNNHYSCPTIDFVLLQDLSGSYSDDLPTLKAQIPNVIATVTGISQDATFGVASFIDKPTGGFGGGGDYVYQTHLSLSADKDAVIAAMNALSTKSGADEPEAQLEGLMQAALREAEVGYRTDARRIVMLSTDSSFHQAGDFGTATPNNGDAILDGGGIGEDYPTIAQVAAALVASGVFPVFSVTTAQKPLYEQLVADLGTGAVVVLSANSSDFADAVRTAIGKACGYVTHEGTENDDSIDGTENDDGIFGIGGIDHLRGLGGSDLVDGGSGDDDLDGGKGGDDLYGGTGDDRLKGGGGRDYLSGGIGSDTLKGGAGRDTFVFNPGDGADTIQDFQSGTDRIDLSSFHRHEGVSAVRDAVQSGADVILTLPSGTSVTLKGFTLADLSLKDVKLNPVGDPPTAVNDAATVISGKSVVVDVIANDSDIDGNAIGAVSVDAPLHGTTALKTDGTILYKSTAGFVGTDTFTYTISDGAFTDTATVTVTVNPNLTGNKGDNVLVGTDGDDLINGFGGDDTIDGKGGNDTILGGTGNDVITAGPAFGLDAPDKDNVRGGAGNDRITGGMGDDTLRGDGGRDTIDGEGGDDQIFGGAGNDVLNGGIDHDEIDGGDGDDTIDGGTGHDQIIGGGGADTIQGGAGEDEIHGSGRGIGDDDILSGGADADVFVFEMSLKQNWTGDDRITDYDPTMDTIALDGDVKVTLTDTVLGALIEQAGGSILVEHIMVHDLRPTITGLIEA